MNVKGYKENEVTLLRATENPKELLELASNITMKQAFKTAGADNLEKRIKYLLDANHTSPFEHIGYTFLIEGASRSFLAQISRHRMASYTSGSQHYQDYRDYGFKIADEWVGNEVVAEAINHSMDAYKALIAQGIPQQEARQVLPNGMENNLMMTANARSLVNFFNLRLCYRNTDEIQDVAEKMYVKCNEHLPELFKYIGPDCYRGDFSPESQRAGPSSAGIKCKQGKMCCGKPWEPRIE